MVDFDTHPPLFQKLPLFKGFLGGSLFLIGLLAPFGFIPQGILFLVGIAVFIDGIISMGNISVVASFLAAVLGGVVSLALLIASLIVPWTILVVIIIVLYYIRWFAGRRATSS